MNDTRNNLPVDFNDTALLLHPGDNVAVLKRPLAAGAVIRRKNESVAASQGIPAGHKIAWHAIAGGEPIIKYGQIIGFAHGVISPGVHVHCHNVIVRDFNRDCQIGCDAKPVLPHPAEQMRYFQGYERADGRAGTRNYLGVVSSVNCSASVSRYVAEHFRGADLRRDFPHIDGIVAFTHKSGCGMQPGEPQHLLERVLAGFIQHPNIAGCVVIGLGCENIQISKLVAMTAPQTTLGGDAAVMFINIQETGGMRRTIEASVEKIKQLLPRAAAFRRSAQPVSKLILATNCGGSDANSGITANPALGVAADELVRYGGTAVLAETPEIYGAEHLLLRRCASQETGEKLLALIRWWQEHVRQFSASIDNNPSFGNKAGGLTTIYEKSLGAIAKAGQSQLMAVYPYASRIASPGLCFMDTPGLDPVSMTGLAAGGCNIAVFTTGRGSVYGCKPVPCVKVASNTPLFRHMEEDMDINAGTILDGTETVEQSGRNLFEAILKTASGESTKSEKSGIGDEEFAPWILGPTF